jgi:signal transduction histidine kinase
MASMPRGLGERSGNGSGSTSTAANLRGRVWLLYLAACLAAAGAYTVLAAVAPRAGPRLMLTYECIGASSALAIVIGVRWHRPVRPASWYLVATAMGMTALGDVVFDRMADVSGLASLRSVPEVLYLIGYPIGGVGLVLLIRRRTPGRDLAALLDALIVVTGLGLLAWTFLVVASFRSSAVPVTSNLSLLSPLLDIVLVALAINLSGGGPRTTAFWLIVTSLVGMLASDTMYALAPLTGAYGNPDPRDLGWLLWFACLGAAALHPSMRTLHERALAPPTRLNRARVTMLLGTVLVAPTLLVIQAVAGKPVSLPVLLAGMAVLFALVWLRMTGLAAAEGARSDRQEQVLDRIVAALEEERTRVAADLHDGPLQQLAGIFYTMERAQSRLERGELAKGTQLLEGLERKLSAEMDAIRRLVVELRPPVLDECGLEAALAQAAKDFSRRAGTACTVDADPDLALDRNRETVLYRVVQEALTNVTKHAMARSVRISLVAEGRAALLEVRDDGVGMSPDRDGQLDGRHFGLTLMRQRVAMAGGSLELRSSVGAGTTLAVHLPLSPRAGPANGSASAQPAQQV